MPFGDVSYYAALTAGVLSFFTPCILPMIPAYIMFITGSSLEEDVTSNRRLAVGRTLLFILGFTIIFVIMGTSATLVGRLFVQNRAIFTKVSGAIIIFFGLILVGLVKSPFKSGGIRMPQGLSGNIGALVMGMAFAAGWTPCFGPVLAGILVMAGGSATFSKGVTLLLIYSIGMGIPFLLTALFINAFTSMLQRMEKVVPVILKIGGIIMIAFGLLIFFDKVTILTQMML